MPSTFPSRDVSLNVPQRYVVQQSHPSPPSSHVDADDTYQYLRRHGIPSKVEQIFSKVLNDRPEDPLQYIVDHLRHKNASVPANPTSTPCSPCSSGRTAPLKPLSPSEGPMDAPESPLPPPAAPPPPPRPEEFPAPMEVTTPLAPSALAVSPPAEHMLRVSLSSASRAHPALRPSSSALLPPWTSLRSSRNGTPYTGPTSFRLGGNLAGDATHSSVGALSLDRDESTRSDLSVFSVASMDMQDFLQEFRSAKSDSVGPDAKLVSVEELSDILQRVNIPLPEVPIISDLFDEVKRIGELRFPRVGEEETAHAVETPASEADGRELVPFDAFLARMALIIQGRYPSELVRGTFYTILESAAQRRCSVSIAAQQTRRPSLKSGDVNGANARTASSGSATSRSFRSAVKSACRSGAGSGLSAGGNNNNNNNSNNPNNNNNNNHGNGGTGSVLNAAPALPASAVSASVHATAMQTYPGGLAHRAAPSDTLESTQLSTLLHGVPLSVCVEEGLWRGLGLPVSMAEVLSTLRTLGIPSDNEYEFHVNDFVRLVNALMGQGGGIFAVSDRASPWTLSLGRDSSLIPYSGSYRDDNV